LPTSIWGYVILYVASLVRIRSSAYHKYSPLQLVFGISPNIFHLRTFGCMVYVPITPPPPQKTKMSAECRIGIY